MMVAFVHISFRWQGYFCSYMYFITSSCTTVRYKNLKGCEENSGKMAMMDDTKRDPGVANKI